MARSWHQHRRATP
ncbi:hypothetical protein CSPAE12_01937 [Colletotrichum incanum]|nr:hypothetical protein CSPAE12_01937 [Colletotrichum incanum]